MPIIKLKTTVLMYPPSEKNRNKIILRYNSELIEFEDPVGDIICLFELLKSGYESAELRQTFLSSYPHSPFTEYMETVDMLGLIEQTDVDSQVLSEYEKSRWSRNLEFYNTMLSCGGNKFGVQRRIMESQVCLLGCGGLGSHILFELAALGIGNITITDFDIIELSNMNRQILYKNCDIGKSKVLTAKERISEFNPAMKVTTKSLRISSVQDISNIITGHDLVICVADKPRDRMVKWLNEACCGQRIPFINGGLDQRRALFYSVIPGVTGCVECWHSSVPEGSVQKQIINTDLATEKDYSAPAPAMSALVSVATGVIVSEAIKLLTGLQPPALSNKSKCFSFDDLTITEAECWSLNPECPCCRETVKNI
ncbi:ThiF family adenylyltransferase [Salmonella enterica]|nr:ThiF family adenylyltransferase [Salmonella enterica subsp. enterica serovar Javiana]EAV6547833.1 ThiF family adenylyltransferase [Salmonella enterica]EDL0765070.1 ThiF family adenylyltransferase [Salmonella enterica subsp. enterica serovar Muenchen]EEJ1462938.1 ThiF family adenylyltransferase [Salmonella enterica subsp. enterica serovar Virginia]EBD0388200.1 ThiF family adenylyltransferase [Salmonella enterica]